MKTYYIVKHHDVDGPFWQAHHKGSFWSLSRGDIVYGTYTRGSADKCEKLLRKAVDLKSPVIVREVKV